MTIRNPIEWSADAARSTARVATTAFQAGNPGVVVREPVVRQIDVSDLGEALHNGWQDFAASRTDVIFICFIYPLAGLIVARLAIDHDFLPLLFPFVAGFALIGPFAAAGLYEMSRRRERGQRVTWNDAFGVFASPAIAAIVKLALLMTGLFALWLATAMAIYHWAFGPAMPKGIAAFVSDVFTTDQGWALVAVGGFVGFLFALLALAVSVVSFPLLLDRQVDILTAVRTSMRAVAKNPVPMLAWGAMVAGLLVLGALPALLGLIVVMPVLGHATWHLYRMVVA